MGKHKDIFMDRATREFIQETTIPAIEVLHRVEKLEEFVKAKKDRARYYGESPNEETLDEILKEIKWVRDLTDL